MQLQVKMQETAEIMYLGGSKQQARYRLKYLEVWK